MKEKSPIPRRSTLMKAQSDSEDSDRLEQENRRLK